MSSGHAPTTGHHQGWPGHGINKKIEKTVDGSLITTYIVVIIERNEPLEQQ
jgi:hypothetical protein